MATALESLDRFELEHFLEAVRNGCGELNAAIGAGMTPAQLKTLMKDPDFAEMVAEVKDRRFENIEQVLYEMAMNKNLKAIQLILERQATHRGWAPPTQRLDVNRNTKVDITVASHAAEALRQLMSSGTDLAQLQPGGALDIIDAEVVE